MLAKMKEIFERKTIKYSLLAITIIYFVVCIALMQTEILNFLINIIETKILHRKLESSDKWKGYLFGTGYSLTVVSVIVWFFFIKNKFYTSLCFLVTVIGIYIYTYKIFILNHDGHDLLRFPVFVLLFVITVHITVNRRYLAPFTNRIKDTKQEIKYYLSGSRVLNSSFFVFICGTLLGSLFFIYIFGTAILDFTYTDWLMSGGDLSQHYLGWRLFRNSSWYFPLGLMDNIVHPFKISIIYTDSIPLFAVIFKLFSPVLPEDFQYFGLFGIICYALQGGIGALIIRKIGGNTAQSIIGSIFFISSTVMMYWIYEHTSLVAHFILLMCILISLENNCSHKKQIILWSCLLALSVLIHMYFVSMVMIFMFFYLLREYFYSKKLINQCIVLGVSLLVLIGTMFCLGAFHFVKDPSGHGLAIYSANLNAFVNPQGTSRFIKDMPLATRGQYEGYAYLGLGMILFIMFIIGHKTDQINQLKTVTISKTKLFPYLLGIVLAFFLFSLSPTITLNQYRLFTYPVFPFEILWSIFRATGRMTWPIFYIIIVFCIWQAVTLFSRKKAAIIMSVLLPIQWADLGYWFVNKGADFKTITTWQTELASPAWADLANDYEHIFFMGDYIKLYSFLDLAANYKMTVNDAYLARTNRKMINENKQKEKEYLTDNGPKDDTVYIFQNEEQALLFKDNGRDIHFFLIDDVFIGINSKKTYLGNYEF